MHIENLLALSKITDHIIGVRTGIFQTLGHTAQTEIQPIVRTIVQIDKLLKPIHHTEHPRDPPIRRPISDTRIRGMTRHLDLIFFRHGHNILQPVIDARPHLVFIRSTAFKLAQRLIQFVVLKRRQPRASAPVSRLCPHMPQNRDIVIQPAQPRFRSHSNRLAHPLNSPIALVAWTQENRASFVLKSTARTQRNVNHLEINTVFIIPIAHGLNHIGSPLRPGSLRRLIDIKHPQLRENLDIRVVPTTHLCSDIHDNLQFVKLDTLDNCDSALNVKISSDSLNVNVYDTTLCLKSSAIKKALKQSAIGLFSYTFFPSIPGKRNP